VIAKNIEKQGKLITVDPEILLKVDAEYRTGESK